jgi:hypothetical protein
VSACVAHLSADQITARRALKRLVFFLQLAGELSAGELMDRSNPKAEFNVKPFKGWLEAGRQVRKGEKSIKGRLLIDDYRRAEGTKRGPQAGACEPW